ncbi:MAG: FGGY-family carbohydrate kinase [Myxococcota bacterium]|nr:FGGY-family carbohydrate kinase [Myxococcota bacterium]
MRDKDLLLAIDNGTQSLKAMVFDGEGTLVAIEKIPFKPYFSSQPGWAEQDPNLFWNTLANACQALFARKEVAVGRIAGMSVTTQRATVIIVDKDGVPLRPAISWLDQRRSFDYTPVGGLWGLLIDVAGLRGIVNYFQSQSKANWIISHEPENWEKTHKLLLVSGFLTHKLTGKFADSIGCQVAYLPFDHKRLDWAKPSSWMWQAVPMSPDRLPELYPQGQVIGGVTREAAQQTGIPEGLPVIAAAADKACEVIGSGSLDPSIGCLSYGTTATINVTSKKYIEAIPRVPAYPAAIPNYHTIEIQIYRGYWMVSWFKEEFGHLELQQAAELGVAPEALFDEMIKDVPPGCMGLMLQPYWTPGVKLPGPEAKGSILGFGDVHTRAYVYRSILEGLAYALRQGKEKIEKRTRIPITKLRVSGGGSQSLNAMQVTADMFGLPTERPHVYETSGLGAAINAAVGTGIHPDYPTAVRAMTRVKDTFTPNEKNAALYDALYKEVYKKMYKQLAPLYKSIQAITGYPKKQ